MKFKRGKNLDRTITGKALHYNVGTSKWYEKELDELIGRMRRQYERELSKLSTGIQEEFAMDASIASQTRVALAWLGRKFSKLFGEEAKRITESFINRVDKAEKVALKDSLHEASNVFTIKTPDMPLDLKERLTASTVENVALIKSIHTQYHDRITSAVMTSVQSGGAGAATIMKEVKHIGGMSEKRAHLIATDQTRKITTAMNSERLKSIGVTQFKWRHSGGGGEPRHLHVQYDGQIFDLDNPPVIDTKTGERGLPGQLINCRCVMIPVIPKLSGS